MTEKWRLAYVVSETLRQKDYATKSFEEFAQFAEQLANDEKPGIPYPWERDGIQAELAAREAGII